MKLRLRKNSIRLRLLRGEVKTLAEIGELEETISFGFHEKLTYRIRLNHEIEEINSKFVDSQISIFVPKKIALDWIETEKIGLYHTQTFGETADESLQISLEKDFVCLDRQDDPDNRDAFPHPTRENC